VSKEQYEIPVRCIGIAAVLLKRINGEYKILLLKRATKVLEDAWCYIGGGIEEGEKAWEAALCSELNHSLKITLIHTENASE